MKRCPAILLLMFTVLISRQTVSAANPVTARVILPPMTATLDPVSLPKLDSSARSIAENLFVGLTRYNPSTRQIEPALAASWSVSDDGLTWTFKLRDTQWVSFDAASQQIKAVRPIVAGDFVYGIRRACDSKPPYPATHTVYIITGCQKVATASAQVADDLFIARELKVQALNDQTLEIKLQFPDPYFTTLASLPEFRPVPRESIAKGEDWTKADTIITDGPFALADWSRDAQPSPTLTLIRNPLWPIKEVGNVERLEITFSPFSDSTAKQLAAGSVDFAPLDFSGTALLKGSKPNLVQSAPGQTVTALGFSVERPLVAKDGVRRALAHAIDRASLIQQVMPGSVLPMSRFTPPGAIDGPTAPPDNSGFLPDDSKTALNSAGYSYCKFTDKIQLLIEDDTRSVALAQALIGQWKANLGCDASMFSIIKGSASMVQEVAHGNIDTSSVNAAPRPEMWIASWTPDYPDANAWTGDAIHCQYGYLRTGLPCGDAEPLVDAAFLEKDPAKRAADYDQAEAIWFGPTGTFPVAPLFVTLNSVGVQPWLKGMSVNGPQRFDLWTLAGH